jgi:cytochrome c
MRLVVFLLASCVVAAPAFGQDAQALLKKHNCTTCHTVDKPLVGPAYKAVAQKYAGQKDAQARLVDKVKKGGAGVWGQVPMPPNPQVPDADVQAMVKYILSLK